MKKKILLLTLIVTCLTFSVGCSEKKDGNKDKESASGSPTTEENGSTNNNVKLENENGEVVQLGLDAVEEVNESEYVATLNKDKASGNFAFTADADMAKVALCETTSENGTKFEAGDEIDSYENMKANEKICICVDVAEGMPNKMLVLTYSDNTTKKCLISFNKENNGAMLIPLND